MRNEKTKDLLLCLENLRSFLKNGMLRESLSALRLDADRFPSANSSLGWIPDKSWRVEGLARNAGCWFTSVCDATSVC